MKVSRAIELLQRYDNDEEIMIAFWASECFETSAGVWDRAVEIFDGQNTPSEYSDYISDIVGDAQAEYDMHHEGMIDAYLERRAEEQANA